MPRVVAHKTDGERTETFIIRVNKKNKAILDGLWKELGAPSRNALFVAAYEAFLSEVAKESRHGDRNRAEASAEARPAEKKPKGSS
jgi:hypothetical protein